MSNEGSTKKNRILLIFEIVFGLILLLAIAGIVAYFTCPLKNVTVEGTDLYTKDEIVGYILDDKYCVNTVYVFLKNKVKPKKSAEFIESFDVKMKDKNTILIKVNEKSILGYMTNDESEYVYFNYDGLITEISKTYIDGYMEVSGVTYDDAKIGEKLSIGESELGYFTTLMKYIKKNKLVPKVIHYDENQNIILVFDDYNISLGSSSYLEEKLERLSYILPEIEGMQGTLHLENFSPNNTDVVFEKQKDSVE